MTTPSPDILRRPPADLTDPLPIPVVTRPFDVAVRPPGSKSITNRALLLAALADGTSELRGALVDADDAKVMLRAIGRLGAIASVEVHGDLPTVRVAGVGGRWHLGHGERAGLDLHNAGTATRFLAAAALLAPRRSGGVVIDGDARMRERPIGELARSLTALGARVQHTGREGYPPMLVAPGAAAQEPGAVEIAGPTASGQFISALLLAAPFLAAGLRLEFRAPITSRPYVDMTLEMLRRLGVRAEGSLDGALRVHPLPRRGAAGDGGDAPGLLGPFTLDIEPDASGATYFEAAAALVPGSSVTIEGLDLGPRPPLQGDARFVGVLTAMGCRVERGHGLRVHAPAPVPHAPPIPAALRPLDADLSDMPDAAMTAAVLAVFAAPTPDAPAATSTLRGLRTLRVKETDRLAALRTELSRLGARVEILSGGGDEALRITPPPGGVDASPGVPPIHFDTYNDHRMAMALALVGLRRPNVLIRNPACVAKTYPAFWSHLARLYGHGPA